MLAGVKDSIILEARLLFSASTKLRMEGLQVLERAWDTQGTNKVILLFSRRKTRKTPTHKKQIILCLQLMVIRPVVASFLQQLVEKIGRFSLQILGFCFTIIQTLCHKPKLCKKSQGKQDWHFKGANLPNRRNINIQGKSSDH